MGEASKSSARALWGPEGGGGKGKGKEGVRGRLEGEGHATGVNEEELCVGNRSGGKSSGWRKAR